MTKQTHFSAKNPTRIFAICVFSLLFLLTAGFFLIPEFSSRPSYATDPVVTSEITLSLSPTSANRSDYRLTFNAPDGTYGSFGTLGINANVTTLNSYGYRLYLRSGSPQARLLYGNMDFATQYIESITSSYSVTSSSGSGWMEMNRYGWSTDWNPATSRGTFNPMLTTDSQIKKTNAATPNNGDNTQVYIGALINDQVMFGKYNGTLVFTAITNALEDVYGTYTLSYDMNGGDVVSGAFPDQSATVDLTNPSADFTINTSLPVRSGFTFLGWDTDRTATTPTYAYSAGVVTPSTITSTSTHTTLYAIWQTTTYTLNFNANSGRFSISSLTASDGASHTFTLPTIIPTRDDDTFLGWGDSITATTPTYAYSAGTFSPSTLTLLESSPTKTLYAVWQSGSHDEEEEEPVSPLGVIERYTTPGDAEETFETDNGGALIIAAASGLAVTSAAFVVLLLVKRKKEEEEELNVED